MSLRINPLVRKIPAIIAIIIGIFLIACIVKIAIWENLYYREKEGTPREPLVELGVTTPNETQEVDETEITPQQVTEFKVSPDKPRYLSG